MHIQLKEDIVIKNHYTIPLEVNKERDNTFGFESKGFNYKVYILENEINLPHKPKYPGQNNHTYFTLHELFSKTEGLEKSSTG